MASGGRVAAREILLTTPAISNLIREGKTFQIPSIIQTSKQLGMLTLNDALVELVEKKEITPDEAYVKSVEKTGLAASLKAKGHKGDVRGMRWFGRRGWSALLLVIAACLVPPTDPGDRRSITLSSGGIAGWRYEFFDQDVRARFDTVIHVAPGTVQCWRFRVSRLAPDTLLALTGSPESGTPVFVARPIDVRGGPGWIWDGVTLLTGPAPLC